MKARAIVFLLSGLAGLPSYANQDGAAPVASDQLPAAVQNSGEKLSPIELHRKRRQDLIDRIGQAKDLEERRKLEVELLQMTGMCK